MSEADARLDYFRSEFEGRLSKAEKGLTDQLKVTNERIRQLEESLAELVREMKHLEMSARG